MPVNITPPALIEPATQRVSILRQLARGGPALSGDAPLPELNDPSEAPSSGGISKWSKMLHAGGTRADTGTTPEPISPLKALLIGSLADSASTYAFLKQGTGHEGNPALQYMNGSPNKVIPSAAAGAISYALLYKLLHKSHPEIADTIAGGLGAYHSELAGHNIRHSQDQGSYASVRDDQMQRALTNSLRNK